MLRLELHNITEQYTELHNRYKTLDSESSQQRSTIQELTAENSELQAKNAMMSSDLNAAQEMKLTLEKRLTLLSNAMEGQKKMMTEEVSGWKVATCTCAWMKLLHHLRVLYISSLYECTHEMSHSRRYKQLITAYVYKSVSAPDLSKPFLACMPL